MPFRQRGLLSFVFTEENVNKWRIRKADRNRGCFEKIWKDKRRT